MTNTITLAFTADEVKTIIIGIARKRNDLDRKSTRLNSSH